MSGSTKGALRVKRVAFGLAIIALVAALALGASVPSASATTKQATQTITSYGQDFEVNYGTSTIWLDGATSSAIVGQVVQFYNATGGASGKVTLNGISDNNAGEVKFSDLSGQIDLSGIKTGDYNVSGEATGCVPTVISIGETSMTLKLKKDSTTIKSIPQGTPGIMVKFTSSLDPNDGVTLEVNDPSGNIIKVNPADGTVFDKVNVEHITDLEIATARWELGTYTLRVATEKEYARGLEKDSDEVELEIVSSELKIAAQKTEIVELENVKLTVTGVPDLDISLLVERNAEHAFFPASINDNPASKKIGTFNDTINADGEMEYVVYFDKIGSYTVKVKDQSGDTDDYVGIAVSKKKVTFTMPETYAIGADLVINGTANTGKTVDIAIEDIIVKVDAAIDNEGTFEVKLATPDTPGTGTEEAITIKAFIDGDFSKGDDASGVDDDGSVMVLMVTGSLTAESSVSLVSPGDSFTLTGTALGPKVVDILMVAPKGGSGNGMNPTNSEENGLPRGIVYEAATVSSSTNTWSIDIDIHEDADTGTHLAFVLTPGKNQIYDELETDDLLAGIRDNYLGGDLSKLAAKTQEQVKSILLDATTEAAGSDDFMKVLKIDVGKAEVALYSIPDVVIGDDLVITGTSNREGHTIIVKVTGPINIGTKFAKVADGKFNATFSTSEALTGAYTVEADDGDGHTDTIAVTIITPVRTEASPTPAPTSSATPTTTEQEPESIPTTQPESLEAPHSPQLPVPGFESVGVVLALLTVYLLVCERRKERRD
jgi:hypothetical protein